MITTIVVQAIKMARAFESGRPPRLPKPRKTVTVTLPAVPTPLVRDLDAWARMRGQSRRDAAIELLKVGLDALSERAERQAAKIRQHPREQAMPKRPKRDPDDVPELGPEWFAGADRIPDGPEAMRAYIEKTERTGTSRKRAATKPRRGRR